MQKIAVLGVIFAALLASGATAQERGPVTSLPLPRYVSMKADEGNVRRGPSLTQRIDWVFQRRDMPLQIVAEYGNWRQVRDRDGAGGWMHFMLLSGVRTVIVQDDLAALHSQPDDRSPIRARAESGVVARLGECQVDWCSISAEGNRGWVRKTQLWGVETGEVRD